jgi:hypothetical protein
MRLPSERPFGRASTQTFAIFSSLRVDLKSGLSLSVVRASHCTNEKSADPRYVCLSPEALPLRQP